LHARVEKSSAPIKKTIKFVFFFISFTKGILHKLFWESDTQTGQYLLA
jgi:hypothetical protein